MTFNPFVVGAGVCFFLGAAYDLYTGSGTLKGISLAMLLGIVNVLLAIR